MLSSLTKALFTDNSSIMPSTFPVFDPSTPSSPASMRASGLVQISPDHTSAGQELHSCVVAILADKLGWDSSKQTVAGMELKYAFGKLGITENPSFYHPFLPASEEALKHLDPEVEILESSFTHRAIVLLCTIPKVLAVAAKERTECFLSPTATFESLTTWATQHDMIHLFGIQVRECKRSCQYIQCGHCRSHFASSRGAKDQPVRNKGLCKSILPFHSS